MAAVRSDLRHLTENAFPALLFDPLIWVMDSCSCMDHVWIMGQASCLQGSCIRDAMNKTDEKNRMNEMDEMDDMSDSG